MDDHLHARQMGARNPRFARRLVRPAACLAGSACSASSCGRLDLLGFLQPEEELIFGQALGPSAEAVPLQFLDDLPQPGILDIAGPSPQRGRIVGSSSAVVAM